MDRKIRVLRTCVGSMSSIGLIREFVRNGCFVVGADTDLMSSGIFADKIDGIEGSYKGILGCSKEEYLEWLICVCNKENIDIVVPSLEYEACEIALHLLDIKAQCPKTKFIVSKLDTVSSFGDKVSTHDAFIRAGLDTPNIHSIYEKDINPYGINIFKPKYGRGSSGIYITKGANEFNYIMTKVNDDYIISDWIEGKEFSVDVLCDHTGKFICCGMRKRLEVESGICIKSSMFYDEDIIGDIKKLCSKYSFYGIFNVQGFLDRKAKKRYYFDLNMRLGGGSILSIKAGAPLIEGLISDYKGNSLIEIGGIRSELVMLRYYDEVFVELGDVIKSAQKR